jgi:DNA polymerase III delta subunit
MITILYGEHTVASRQKLIELIDLHKKQGELIERLEAKRIDPANLEMALAAQDLFGAGRVVVIEGLHSLPKSTKKNELVKQVAASTIPVILWESRDLTPTMIKQFPKAEVLQFKLTKSTFVWLDSLSGDGTHREQAVKIFHQALAEEDAQFLFIMLARQVRLLIQAKDGGVIKGPPFMISKLKKQAGSFAMEKLLTLHSKLLSIDLGFKTSSNNLTLAQELDLLLLTM